MPQLFLKVHNRLQWSLAREGSGRIERPLQVPQSLIFFLETNNGPRNDTCSSHRSEIKKHNFKGCRFKLHVCFKLFCVKLYLFLILFCFLHHSSYVFFNSKVKVLYSKLPTEPVQQIQAKHLNQFHRIAGDTSRTCPTRAPLRSKRGIKLGRFILVYSQNAVTCIYDESRLYVTTMKKIQFILLSGGLRDVA